MPVEHDQEPFETRLGHALRDAGDHFTADRTALVDGGLARGRRQRLRRRTAVLGGVAGVALAGVGGTLLTTPWDDGSAPRPTTSGRPSTQALVAPVTGHELIRSLKEMLPDGKVSGQEAQGGADRSPAPYARLVFDDGKGAAAVVVGLDRIGFGGQHARQTVDCPDRALVRHDACVSTKLSDGSLLRLFQGYVYGDRRAKTKLWSADLVTPAGQHVFVKELNAAAEKDSPVTRAEPPLSTARLRKLVTAPVWRGYVDSLPEDPLEASDPPAEPSVDSVLDTLAALLPRGAKVVERGEDYSFLVLDDGEGRGYVQVDVQQDMGDVAGDLFGEGSGTLPDGTLVDFRENGGDKGVPGAVMWTVDSLRTDGFRVVVSALNAPSQHDAPSRTAPVLTQAQLRKIALSARWDRYR
ncbi:hypothetical protein [Streptomyces sp. NPDC046859]|uniref:hypothetical protein n=1 Tax=Streptomyces sp. NPDC046859 TaxID=3155734 RepID=UPI0033F7A4DA